MRAPPATEVTAEPGGAGGAWYTLPVYTTSGKAKGEGKGGKAGGLHGYGAQAARRLARFLSKVNGLYDIYIYYNIIMGLYDIYNIIMGLYDIL